MRRRANLTEKMPPFTTSHVNTRVFKMACSFADFSRFGQREYDVIPVVGMLHIYLLLRLHFMTYDTKSWGNWKEVSSHGDFLNRFDKERKVKFKCKRYFKIFKE